MENTFTFFPLESHHGGPLDVPGSLVHRSLGRIHILMVSLVARSICALVFHPLLSLRGQGFHRCCSHVVGGLEGYSAPNCYNDVSCL